VLQDPDYLEQATCFSVEQEQV